MIIDKNLNKIILACYLSELVRHRQSDVHEAVVRKQRNPLRIQTLKTTSLCESTKQL